MLLSRRKLLEIGTVAGVSLTGAHLWRQRNGGSEAPALDRNDLRKQTGTSFRLLSGRFPFLDLTLLAVTDFPGRAFSAIFRGPSASELPQDVYCLDHPELGAKTLLLVPIGLNAEGRLYEAVINSKPG